MNLPDRFVQVISGGDAMMMAQEVRVSERKFKEYSSLGGRVSCLRRDPFDGRGDGSPVDLFVVGVYEGAVRIGCLEVACTCRGSACNNTCNRSQS